MIIVHGLWMNGMESLLLRDRLEEAGFAPSLFRYPSTQAALPSLTAALAARMRSHDGDVHLVGHSLGGLVVIETLEAERELPPGRVVLLGAPVQGSRAAGAVASWSFGPRLLGPLAVAELTRPRTRRWQLAREIGLISGTRSVGVGRFLTDLPGPNDGTVAVEETRLPGATEHIVQDVSHLGMLVSRRIAESVGTFLGTGSFARARP